jgi:hypothetical protein
MGESLAIFRELEIAGYIQNSLDGLGCVLCALGELDHAADVFAEGLVHSQDLEDERMVLSILSHMSELAVRQRRAARALRLAGAVATGEDATGISLPPIDRQDLELTMGRAQEMLAAELCRRAWGEGRAMDLQVAVEYALERPSSE